MQVAMSPLGEAAYNGYRKESNNKSLISGEPLPEWSELSEPIRRAWIMASDAAIDKAIELGYVT